MRSFHSLAIVTAAALYAPLIASLLALVHMPVAVVEIALGVVGPEALLP